MKQVRSKVISKGKVTNPRGRARRQGILAELQAQRQAAESERSQALAIRRPSGAQGGAAGVALSKSGASGAPAFPTKVRSGGPGAEISGESPPAAAPDVVGPSASPQQTQFAPICLNPEIRSVNGKVSGVTFTPETQGNLHTIRGCLFGDVAGKAHIYG